MVSERVKLEPHTALTANVLHDGRLYSTDLGPSLMRYPNNLTEEEAALVKSLIPAAKRGGNGSVATPMDVGTSRPTEFISGKDSKMTNSV